MIVLDPIGTVRSAYTDQAQVPKGTGARHDAEGVLEIRPEFEAGLTDIEGYSHLYVLWIFDRAEGFSLMSQPPNADRPHGVFSTRSPHRPNAIGLTVVELSGATDRGSACAEWTCSTARRSWTSSRISRAFRPSSCAAAGSVRRSAAEGRDDRPATDAGGAQPPRARCALPAREQQHHGCGGRHCPRAARRPQAMGGSRRAGRAVARNRGVDAHARRFQGQAFAQQDQAPFSPIRKAHRRPAPRTDASLVLEHGALEPLHRNPSPPNSTPSNSSGA